MPEPVQITLDFNWLTAVLAALVNVLAVAGVCVAGCRHIRKVIVGVMDELHANTDATKANGAQLTEIKQQLAAGNKRFGVIEQRLAGHEATLEGLTRRVG